jgi:carboxymethylenebutenolidase
MSGEYRTIQTDDGQFQAYTARPAGEGKAPAIVVLQEIFGVNAVMREIADDLAAKGFIAICPDLFWRIQPGVDITDQSEEEWKQAFDLMNRFDANLGVNDIGATIATIRHDPRCSGKVGAVGYCLGGKLAFLTATRTTTDASDSYYVVGLENLLDEYSQIRAPLMLHIAAEDSFSSKAAQKQVEDGLAGNNLVAIHVYEDRDHAFARPGGQNYDKDAAELANQRTLDFFKSVLG